MFISLPFTLTLWEENVMWEENVVTAPKDGNAQNVAQAKLRSATLKQINSTILRHYKKQKGKWALNIHLLYIFCHLVLKGAINDSITTKTLLSEQLSNEATVFIRL